jgi:glycosyltransferase involved in cell wall biosynthesis
MKIGIDGNEANIAQRVGSNVYAFQVIQELHRLGGNTNWQVYLKRPPLQDMPPPNKRWQYQVFGPPMLWTRWRLPIELYLQRDRPDLFFSPGHYAPWFCPIPLVVTIMDLAFLRYPKDFRQQDLKQLKFWTEHSVRQAAHILAISEATKRDLVSLYGIDEAKITVTYPGYDWERFKSASWRIGFKNKAGEKVESKYGISGKYLIYVGTLQPRKNVVRLVEAFAQIRGAYPDLHLVIVGKKGWLYDDIFQTVQKLELQDRVIFTGYVPDEEMPALISQARACVLPSLYEGFGIPVVEAMACGVPVVVSQVSSLPELAGEAGIYIKDPNSVASIAQGLQQVLKLSESRRKTLIARGLKQAQRFSWETCGHQTLAALQRAAGFPE